VKRDTVKTLAGLLVIAVIVVATFMYGNAQRQSQLKHDKQVKAQQDAKAAEQARKSQPVTGQSAQAAGQPAANTAPVQSPSSNSIQGSKPSSTPVPQATGQVAGAQTTPTAGGTAMANKETGTDGDGTDPLPQTGSPLTGVIGATAVLGAAVLLARSKRAMYDAARRPR
jgi:LPXTG-motif cell wall-anchored protein